MLLLSKYFRGGFYILPIFFKTVPGIEMATITTTILLYFLVGIKASFFELKYILDTQKRTFASYGKDNSDAKGGP